MSKKSKEEDSKYYNLAYSISKAYKKRPENIPEYYNMWLAGAESVKQVNPSVVVDLGCGAGHFGEILKRLKASKKIDLKTYYGYDFSNTAIRMARRMVSDPNFAFQVKDLFEFKFVRGKPEDTMYVSYEFLEHVERDLEVISEIPKGSAISFSVPSFDSKGHVRFFKSVKEVRKRYGKLIKIESCKKFIKKAKTDTEPALVIYLCFGRIK